MKTIIWGQSVNEGLNAWVAKRLQLRANIVRGQSMGIISEEGILAAVLYDDFNGANLFMHIAAVPGKRWLNRRFLWMMFHYPFVQLGCKRITAGVPSTNLDCRRFVEHLGMELEATLKDAVPDGDLLVYRWLANCPKLQRILEIGHKEGFDSAETRRTSAA